MSSPYKRPILDSAISDLNQRLKTYKSGPHWKAAVRNPAYCKMYWKGGSIPRDTIEWSDTYRIGRMRKPAPALQLVEITLNSDDNNKFSIMAKFTIKVFTKQDFESTVDTLCKQGESCTFEWGYGAPYGTGYTGKTIRGFKLSTFTFNTESDGTYLIEGTAVGPSPAMEALNANFQIKNSPTRKYINDGKSYDVTGIVELITYWAQGNGKKSIDDMEDGDVLLVPDGICSDGTPQKMGSIMIFDSKHLEKKGFFAAAGRAIKSVSETSNELAKTNNIVYVSLETIVGLFNSEVFPMYSKSTQNTENSKDFSKLKIEFDPVYSFAYIDKSIRSAYPTKVLIMGPMHGNYKNAAKAGKNFWEDAKNKDAVKTVVGESEDGSRKKIDLKKIFVERSLILAALDGTYEKVGNASTIDNRINRDASINVGEFFKRIFDEIKSATGDRISLVLSMHPDVFDAKDEKAHSQFVFDETNGSINKPRDVWEFNPIDGDGITRSFSIKSEQGSQNYQMSQYFGVTTSTDVMAQSEGKLDDVEKARKESRDKAIKDIVSIIKNPGQLGDSAFDDVHMQALKTAFITLKDSEPSKKKNNNMVFIGLGCDVELDGIWGIGPGTGIWSTQMPDTYKKNSIFFAITSTVHKFDGETSDWSTTLTGLVSTDETVNYLPKTT